MNILIVAPYFAPAWAYGGPPRILYQMAKFLTDSGHSVTVFTTNVLDEKNIHKEFRTTLDGIEVFHFTNISKTLAYQGKIFLPLGLGNYTRRHLPDFDVVLMSDARTYLNAVAYKYLKKEKIPFVHFAFGSLPYAGSILKKLLKLIYDHLWLNHIMRDAHILSAQTEHEKSEYVKLGADPGKVKIIPLAVDRNLFLDATINCDSLKRSGEDFRLISVGRINSLKTPLLMVDVFDKLVRKYSEALKWTLIGRDDGFLGRLTSEINRRGLSGNFCFAGPMYGADKVQELKRADCFFLAPSHFEETSTAALEALACGTPCVITEQCEVPYLNEYQGGFMTRFDADELAAAIDKIISVGKAKYSPNCIKLIKDHFNWEIVGQLLESNLQAILHEKGSAHEQ